MKDALVKHFSNVPEGERCGTVMLLRSCQDLTNSHRQKLRVLVPGAGLGRLAYDVAHLGRSYFDTFITTVTCLAD